ncbi:hypothetical protein AMECASPLE_039416, partial [Ameca splendens]
GDAACTSSPECLPLVCDPPWFSAPCLLVLWKDTGSDPVLVTFLACSSVPLRLAVSQAPDLPTPANEPAHSPTEIHLPRLLLLPPLASSNSSISDPRRFQTLILTSCSTSNKQT